MSPPLDWTQSGIRSPQDNQGIRKTILLSTHILQEVPEVADRIILINNGRLIFEGTPDEVKGESSLDAWFNKQTLAA